MKTEIAEIYKANEFAMESCFVNISSLDDTKHDSYVYAWHTVNPKKYFYVGKGKGKRYEHILKEILAYEKNKRKFKGKNYKLLKDNFGIAYKILYNDLTNREAAVVEISTIAEYIMRGEPLLNQIIPWEYFGLGDKEYERWESVLYSGEDYLVEYFRSVDTKATEILNLPETL